MRPRRNEERVEELGLPIERRLAGDEVDGDLVAAGLEMLRRNHEMVGDDRRLDRLRVDAHDGMPLFGTKSNASGRVASFRTNVITTRPSTG